MQEWQVVDLRKYDRNEFKDFHELEAYIREIMPKNDGSRTLAIGPVNSVHHWTLGLVPMSGASSYIHIDSHPDDTDLYCGINSASFVHFLPEHSKVNIIRVIGTSKTWARCDRSRDYRRGISCTRMEALHSDSPSIDANKLTEFLKGTDDAYLSIDIDVIYNANERDIFEVVDWIVQNKNVKGADIYPCPYGWWSEMIEPLAKMITSKAK
jgi:arginase family enzyme